VDGPKTHPEMVGAKVLNIEIYWIFNREKKYTLPLNDEWW